MLRFRRGPPWRSRPGPDVETPPGARCVGGRYASAMTAISTESPAADPLSVLCEIAASEASLVSRRHEAVVSARAAGATWDDIAVALGVDLDTAIKIYSTVAWQRLDATADLNLAVSDEDANALAVRVINEERLGLPLP